MSRKFLISNISYDEIIERVRADPAAQDIPPFLIRVMLVTAVVSAMHYLDEDNHGVMLSALALNSLAERGLRDHGITDRVKMDAAFSVVDRLYAEEYEKATVAANAARNQTQIAKIES